MLWSMIRLILKMISVTPDFFYIFNLILSFSTYSQSFKKICAWELLGANVLKSTMAAKFCSSCVDISSISFHLAVDLPKINAVYLLTIIS